MSKFVFRMHITAPPEIVFRFASDFHRAAEHIKGIEKLEVLTDGPVGVGTRFRETRIMYGKQSTEELEVTAFDEPHGYTVECQSCGCYFRSKYFMVGDIAGTHVRMEMDCQPISLFAKLMSPISRLMMGSVKKCIEADLEDLRVVAEDKAKQMMKAEM
jgi:hypothetical protein